MVQISLHLHLDRHLALTSTSLNLTKQTQAGNENSLQRSTNDRPTVPIIHQQPDKIHYTFSKVQAEISLQTHGRDVIFQPLRAYVEKELNDTVPGTVDVGNLEDKRPKIEVGRPGRWYVPLPLREGSPDDVSYYFAYSVYCVCVFFVSRLTIIYPATA